MNFRLIELYTKYLFGKISKDEFLEMRHFISKTSNHEMGKLFSEVWGSNRTLPSMDDESKQNITKKLDFYIENDKKRRRKIIIQRYAIAASFLLIIGCGILYLNLSKQTKNIGNQLFVEVERGQKASITLPDKTLVWLNSDTKISYDIDDKKQRSVDLKGEAYFKVTKDKNRPFVVKMGEIQVEVLGTSFNIQTYADDDNIKASLIEGSIKLSGEKLPHDYYLNPNEQFVYSKKHQTFNISSLDGNKEIGWMHDKLEFKSEPLSLIIRKIERWYDVSIDLNCKDLADDRMTGSFQNEDINVVMEAIRIQYKIQYKIKGNHISIFN